MRLRVRTGVSIKIRSPGHTVVAVLVYLSKKWGEHHTCRFTSWMQGWLGAQGMGGTLSRITRRPFPAGNWTATPQPHHYTGNRRQITHIPTGSSYKRQAIKLLNLILRHVIVGGLLPISDTLSMPKKWRQKAELRNAGVHTSSSLSCDSPIASSKASSPYSAI